ncbi:MAG: hypothetical protein JW862_05320 [Anaerolineales bacterium]|nr:hypothetical protein [Anaerolineales bacterium]
MKTGYSWLFFALGVVLLSACSPGADPLTSPLPSQTPLPPSATPISPSATPLPPTETPIPPSETPAPPTPTPTETATPVVHISLVNDTGEWLCGVFFYSSDYYGDIPNLINVEAGDLFLPDEILEFELVPGNYNVSVWDCAGNKLHDFPFYDLAGQELNWALSEPLVIYTEALVTIVNQLSYDLCEFYVRPAESTDWGENLLSPEWGIYITIGSTYLHWVDVGGVYDFQLRYCDGTLARELLDQEIPSNMEWTLNP